VHTALDQPEDHASRRAGIPRTRSYRHSATNYAEAERNGYFLHRPDGRRCIADWWKGTGSLIDFTNPAARKWWQGQVGKAIAMGADGFKDDDAEGNFIVDVKFASARRPAPGAHRYAVDLQSCGGRWRSPSARARTGVLFQRCGTSGSNGLPLFWSGDNDANFSPRTASLPWSPPA